MPCRSDYMEPNPQERESKAVAQHLVYMLGALGNDIPEYVQEASRDYYGGVKNLDNMTSLLCNTIRALSPNDLETIVFDGRVSESRALADWWEYHQKADAKRKEYEQTQAQKTKLKKSGLAKLTKQEREALGL